VITLSRTFIRAEASLKDSAELEEVGEVAYHAAEQAAGEVLELRHTGSRVEVSEGSTEVVAMIITGAAALITAIGNYDSFWAGVDRIRAHARLAGDFVRRQLKRDDLLRRSSIVSSRVTTGQLTSLDRLHRRVHERQLDPDEAVQKALSLLADADEPLDDHLVRSLELAFGAPREGLARINRLPKEDRGIPMAVEPPRAEAGGVPG
jgi:hypothetical protein